MPKHRLQAPRRLQVVSGKPQGQKLLQQSAMETKAGGILQKDAMNYTYILRCADGTLYTGWTNDLDRRLEAHNAGKGGKYTRARLPVALVYSETFETKQEAQRREFAIKKLSRQEKEKIMNAIINFEELVARQISHIQVMGEGIVTHLLNDDLIGHKHQRFVVELAPHKTVMILNNIDVWPRIAPLELGDRVAFFGEYIWNRHGGIVHWTHPDPRRVGNPAGAHVDGYVRVLADKQPNGTASPIPVGIYRHYKGNLYEVVGMARHSETLEDMVVYKALYGEGGTWVRPASMWDEPVEVDGKTVRRFEKTAVAPK
jgi:putative endonuclease